MASTDHREDEDTETLYVRPKVGGEAETAPTVISIQPQARDPSENRRPIPITTSGVSRQLVPLSGLQLLHDEQQLFIQQTFELNSLTSGLDSENRYLVKGSSGNTLLGCVEASSSWGQKLCGPARGFSFRLVDATTQEALALHRRTATCCFHIPCRLERVEVVVPPGEYIGGVRQEWSWDLVPSLLVLDSSGSLLYRIRAARRYFDFCSDFTDSVFYLTDCNGMDSGARISHEWNPEISDYSLSIVFPTTLRSVRIKALIVASAFLLEYVFFLKTKRKSCCSCCHKR